MFLGRNFRTLSSSCILLPTRCIHAQGEHLNIMATASLSKRALSSGGKSAVGAAVGTAVAHAQAALLSAKAVAFDVDSTMLTGEGIDALAATAGCEAAVADWTAK